VLLPPVGRSIRGRPSRNENVTEKESHLRLWCYKGRGRYHRDRGGGGAFVKTEQSIYSDYSGKGSLGVEKGWDLSVPYIHSLQVHRLFAKRDSGKSTPKKVGKHEDSTKSRKGGTQPERIP